MGSNTDITGQAPRTTPAPAGRLAPLDGLRGVAACGVAFLFHPLLEYHPDAMATAPRVALWLRDWGWMFVDLFFLISGYIFAHVYLQAGRLDRAGLGDFAVARIARLYPLHLLMLLVTALMVGGASDNTALAFAAHLVMLQAFVAPVGHTFDGPTWSLSIEAVCYVIFALAAVRGDKVLRWVTAAAIVLPLAYLLVEGRPGGPWAGDCLPRGLLGFFLGQVLWRRRADLARVPAALLAVLMLIGLTIDMGTASPLLPICLLAWPAALGLALRVPAMGSRALLWLGDRSYAIYLIHYPVLLFFLPTLHDTPGGWACAGVTLAYVPIVLALSDLAYRRFEVPARKAIRAAWARRTARAEAGVRPA